MIPFAVVTVGGFVACILAYAIPGAMLLFAFGAPLFALLFLLVTIILAVSLARAYWPAALALIPALALLYLLVAVPRPPLGAAATSADWLQFLFLWHELDQEASSQNIGDKGTLVVHPVDGFIVVGSHGFVYDSTGQIAFPISARSEQWRSVASKTVLASDCDWTARRLFGPYYSYYSSC